MSENVDELLTELVRQGLKARLVARPDACPACRKLHSRIFEPLVAPSIPIRDCQTPPCRCRYEGFDPRPLIESLLSAGIAAVKEQKLEEARELLYQVIDLDERSEKAWLWLSGVAEGIDERILCLENVLAINPHNELAKRGLGHLRAERRAVGSGEDAAKKIKEAREAIGHIRTSQKRASLKPAAVKERVPAATVPAREKMDLEYVTQRRPTEVRATRRLVFMAFLYALLVILILVLVWAALTYTGGIV